MLIRPFLSAQGTTIFTWNFYSHTKTNKLPVPKIPKHKLDLSFTRSGGPGGQNVNKLNTQVEIRFNLEKADWIDDELKARFSEIHKNKINKLGEVVIVSNRERTQEANLRDCMEKLEDYLEESSILPKEWIRSEKPDWTKEERKIDKKIRSEKKKSRSKSFLNDW